MGGCGAARSQSDYALIYDARCAQYSGNTRLGDDDDKIYIVIGGTKFRDSFFHKALRNGWLRSSVSPRFALDTAVLDSVRLTSAQAGIGRYFIFFHFCCLIFFVGSTVFPFENLFTRSPASREWFVSFRRIPTSRS
jgi:hypothetical protein